jgi:hypothetical protein
MANFCTVRSVCWQWRAIADRFAPMVLAELTASNTSDTGVALTGVQGAKRQTSAEGFIAAELRRLDICHFVVQMTMLCLTRILCVALYGSR